MALYEHLLIARQDISAQQVDALATHLKTIVEGEDGKVEKQEYWGLRSSRLSHQEKPQGPLRAPEHQRACARPFRNSNASSRSTKTSCAIITVKVDQFEQSNSNKARRERDGDKKPEGEDLAGDRTMSQAGAQRRPFFRRRKTCPFSGANAPKIDYKDVKLLQRFISERGKIVPSRITAVSTKKQRLLAVAIKRARFMALLPYRREGRATMQVILLERVEKLGQIGDVVKVKDGFARNYLLPKKKALRATKANRALFRDAACAARSAQSRAQGGSREDRQEARRARPSCCCARRATAASSMARCRPRDIADIITAGGFTVDRTQVPLDKAIKTIGLFPIAVVLHPEVRVTVTINVARTEDEAERQARGEDVLAGEDGGRRGCRRRRGAVRRRRCSEGRRRRRSGRRRLTARLLVGLRRWGEWSNRAAGRRPVNLPPFFALGCHSGPSGLIIPADQGLGARLKRNSRVTDIFREVEEDVRREHYEQLWKKYGDYVIAGAAVLVIAVAGIQLWRIHEQRQQAKASDEYSNAEQMLDGGRRPRPRTHFAQLQKTAPGGYAQLAKLQEANAMLAAGNRPTPSRSTNRLRPERTICWPAPRASAPDGRLSTRAPKSEIADRS